MTGTVDTLLQALYASFAAGLGTSVGAVAVFTARTLSARTENVMLSAAAGVMLAASFFSLLQPSIGIATAQLGHPVPGILLVIGGLMAGGFGLHLLHDRIPHEHFHTGHEGPSSEHLQRIWLFVIAITLHNFPEGMAVGVGFAQARQKRVVLFQFPVKNFKAATFFGQLHRTAVGFKCQGLVHLF